MKKQECLELKKIFDEIRQGNTSEIEILYEKYNKMIYGIAFSILKNREDAEDIVQNVFSKLYEMDKDKMPQDKEATWLYSVTKNEALMFLRKKNSSYDIDKIYNIENEISEIDNLIDKESYNQIINRLKSKEKEIVSLKILSGLSFEQISNLLGEPTGTIKWRYYKSMYELKAILGNLAMIIVTFTIGLTTFKQKKKTSDGVGQEIMDTDTTNEMFENSRENLAEGSLDLNKTESKPEGTDAIENMTLQNTVIETQVTDNNVNYIGLGLLGISGIVLIVTIIFMIFLRKRQLNLTKKASK